MNDDITWWTTAVGGDQTHGIHRMRLQSEPCGRQPALMVSWYSV